MIWSVSYHVPRFLCPKVGLSFLVSAAAQRLIHTANISTNVVTDKKAKFTCKPKFLLVLRTLPNVDKNRTVFTYEEVRRNYIQLIRFESLMFCISGHFTPFHLHFDT